MKDIIVNWYSTPSQGQGYSGQAELLSIALNRIEGFDVYVLAPSKLLKENLTEEGKEIMEKPFRFGSVGITLGFPNAFTSMINTTKIGFTMFETDKLPSGSGTNKPNDWCGVTGRAADIINRIDNLWVPSEHNVELFKREGVEIPIHKVLLGYDPKMYPDMSKRRAKTRKDRPFTFLMLGALTSRKNPGGVIMSFMNLFSDKRDVQLVLKTHSGTLGHLIFPSGVNIKIIDRYMTVKEMQDLYSQADCFVFPSRGEGFGLPPLEAMATGLPVILADNTGMSEFCNEKYNYPIKKHTKTKAMRFPKRWGDVGNWYDPDYNEIRERMKYVYEHQEEAREKGKAAAKWVAKNFTVANTAESMAEYIQNAKAASEVSNRIGPVLQRLAKE